MVECPHKILLYELIEYFGAIVTWKNVMRRGFSGGVLLLMVVVGVISSIDGADIVVVIG